MITRTSTSLRRATLDRGTRLEPGRIAGCIVVTQKKTGSKRKTYHHGDLVTALVRAATTEVDRVGHESLSVREIARAVGVSPAAPFRHFRDRDDLLRAVAFEARLRHAALASEALDAAGDEPLAQFRALGSAQVRFAIRHPNLQRLVQLPSMREPPSTATDEERESLRAIHDRTSHLVAAAQSRGTMREGDPAVLELAGIALVYGLTQLFLEGLLPREGGEALAESVIDVLGSGFAGANADAAQAASRPVR